MIARFQVLGLEVEVATELPEIVDEVRFFTQGARQPWTPADTGRYEVTIAGDEYVVDEDGVAWDPEGLAESVGSLLFHRVYTRALASFPHHVELAVACVVLEGKRLLLVGDALAGTTALTTALLYRGAGAETDGACVMGAAGLTSLPRPFYFHPGIEDVVPDVAPLLGSLPMRAGPTSMRLWAFDPAAAGFDWSVGTGPVDALVAVEPNHGGRTRVEQIARYEMVRRLVARAIPRSEGWIAQLTLLADAAECRILRVGDVDGAVLALGRLCA